MQSTALLRSLIPNLPPLAPAVHLPTGIAALDTLIHGLPRGAITEIFGPPSSGRTSLLFSVLAQSTGEEDVCAWVDTGNAFDPASAAEAGVALHRLLWVRCGGNAEHALKVTDLLVQGGGFGMVVMDLGDTPPRTARRISLASWYRFRHAVEHTRTVLAVVGLEPYVRQCAALSLETSRERVDWSGAPDCSQLLDGARWGVRVHAARRMPVASEKRAVFEASALG
jgi:hypothetical protein